MDIKQGTPQISVLVLARPDSKYLARCLMTYFTKTAQDQKNTEVIVLAQEDDNWNDSLFRFFDGFCQFCFYKKDATGEVESLLEHAMGDWIICLSDDKEFICDEWDDAIRKFIRDNKLNYHKPHVIVPVSFDCAVAVLSREYADNIGTIVNCKVEGNIFIMSTPMFRKMEEVVL